MNLLGLPPIDLSWWPHILSHPAGKWRPYVISGCGHGGVGREGITWLSETELNREDGHRLRALCPPKRNASHQLLCTCRPAPSSLCSDMPWAQRKPRKRQFSAATRRRGEFGQIRPVVWNPFFLGLVLTRSREAVAYNVASPHPPASNPLGTGPL